MRAWQLFHVSLLFISMGAQVHAGSPAVNESQDATGLRASAVSLERRHAVTQTLPQEITLTLTNALPFARSAEPVSCGIPLARGFVHHAHELVLLDGQGAAVPVQLKTTSTYRDGTPRWVLLTFLAHVPAQDKSVYTLKRGARPPISETLTYRLNKGLTHIDTGTARFQINTNRFRLFDAITVGDQALVSDDGIGGAVLEEANGSQHRVEAKATNVEIEEKGPLALVLTIKGEISPGPAHALAEFVCHMTFYAGKSEVRVFYTLHNPGAHQHPGNTWDLGTGGSVFMEDLSLLLPLAADQWSPRIGVGGDQAALKADALYQDSSGGPHWNSANHVDKDLQIPLSFRGFRVSQGRQRVHQGQRAEGWLHVRSASGGVAVGVRDFWQNFPKALSYANNTVRVGLWPRESAGIHELLLVFHDGRTSDTHIAQRMQAFHTPMYAMPDPKAIYATRALWSTGPINRQDFARLEQTCDTLVHAVGTRAIRICMVNADICIVATLDIRHPHPLGIGPAQAL
jgi:hypothetical protein